MADPGHKRTDKELEALEKRLREVYTQSAEEMQKKLDDYFKRFQIKDEKWRQWLHDGEVTEEEYKQWRTGQMAVGKRWEKMRDRLVSDQMHTNQIAREIVDREMPGIFELNANYAIYQVEHDAQIDTSMTLYNREAVDMILRDDPDLLLPPGKKVSKAIQEGKAQRWEKQKIQSTLLQGILQGESIPKLAARLASEVNDSDHKAAVRNARTMATNAQNAGRYDAYDRLKNKGIDLTLEWAATLDNRTRHSHRMMHGQRRDVGEPFEVDGVKIMYPTQAGTFKSVSDVPQEMIWNCFTGDNMVDVDSQIVRSYKHEYSGELVTIETASGINFTCTPNHPILTRFGWIHAAALHKGDDLLVTSTVNNGSVRRDRDVDHVHASFEALHESLSNLGRVDQRPMTDFNFHGDIPTSDVEVVSQKRLLRGCIDTGISQGFYESFLKNADPLVFSKRHLVASFRRVYISTLRFMSRSRKALSLLWRSICHANVHGLGAVADRDVVLPEYAINDLPAETIIRSQLLDGLAGRVFVDNIISVHKRSSTCHVYNLQTENGYYFVGSSINRNGGKSNGNYIIAKNCRCTILAYVKGYEHDTIKHSDKMGEMTFEEWLGAKSKSQDILSQEKTGEEIKQGYIKEYQEGKKKNQAEPFTPAEGKDITGTWKRRSDQFDFEIDDVMHAQGFDGKPRVVPKEEFDEAVKAANGGHGFIAQRTYSAPDQESLDEYRSQLYHGKWYVDCSTGGAVFGKGMYTSSDYTGTLSDSIKMDMKHYKDIGESRFETHFDAGEARSRRHKMAEDEGNAVIKNGGTMQEARAAYDKIMGMDEREWAEKYAPDLLPSKGVSYVETMTLDPSAKIVTHKEMDSMRSYSGIQERLIQSAEIDDDQRAELYQVLVENEDDSSAISDPALRKIAEGIEKKADEMMHYDIGTLAAMYGYDAIHADGYTVILNRTKVIILRED